MYKIMRIANSYWVYRAIHHGGIPGTDRAYVTFTTIEAAVEYRKTLPR